MKIDHTSCSFPLCYRGDERLLLIAHSRSPTPPLGRFRRSWSVIISSWEGGRDGERAICATRVARCGGQGHQLHTAPFLSSVALLVSCRGLLRKIEGDRR